MWKQFAGEDMGSKMNQFICEDMRLHIIWKHFVITYMGLHHMRKHFIFTDMDGAQIWMQIIREVWPQTKFRAIHI